MTCPDYVQHALEELVQCRKVGDAVVIDTHCLYPAGGIVQVHFVGGAREVVAHDGGGAIRTLLAHGLDLPDKDVRIHKIAKSHGLSFKEGKIQSKALDVRYSSSLIVHVANASKEVCEDILRRYRFKKKINFQQALDTFVSTSFSKMDYKKNFPVRGMSERQYKFDYVINADSKRILVDAVLPDPNSLNARIVANLDVARRGDETIIQRIVYDEDDNWDSSSIELLRTAAPTVPFKYASEELYRIAERIRH